MNIKVVTPVYRYVEPETDTSMGNMLNTSKNAVVWRKTIGDSLISRSRNEAIKEFLSENYEYLMFMDADIVWLADAQYSNNPIDRLASLNLDIVGGIYVVKGGNYHPSIRTLENQEKYIKEKKWNNEWKYDIKDGVFEVQYMSSGFMMISRECAAKVCEKAWHPFAPMAGANAEYLSEDWAFCHRAKEIGHKVYADSTIKLGHVGRYIYTVNDSTV